MHSFFLDLHVYFALVYLFHYCFSKNAFEINHLFSFESLIIFNFLYIPLLPLTLFFICRHDYGFGSDRKWSPYSVKDPFSF